MSQPKLDRRVQRTRRLLNAALIALMQERRYDTISIQDIIDRADVGRSTFYAHFRDKEDLLLSGFEGMLGALVCLVGPPVPGEPLMFSTLELFRHVQGHSFLYRALVRGRGIELLFKRGQAFLGQHIEQQIIAALPPGQVPRVPTAILAEYVAGTLLTLLKWWLEHQMPYPAEQVEELFQQLVRPTLRELLKEPGAWLPDSTVR